MEGGNGHGCGHNLLGAGSMAAVLALKQYMEESKIPGTLVFYGCPAEETMTGKIRMAADGAFRELDVALTWHPWQFNGVLAMNMQAMDTVRFTFHGISAHAAASPELGRSALDAVELMNVGVNYLREHIPDDVRIHYTITNGGGSPDDRNNGRDSAGNRLLGYFAKPASLPAASQLHGGNPSAQIGVAAVPMNTACHTWQFTACAGGSMGQKSMIYAAKVLALAGTFKLKTVPLSI